MAQPANKAPKMAQALDKITESLFGRARYDSIKQDICVICGNKVKTFRNEISKKEYTISGMCQGCQDETFGEN